MRTETEWRTWMFSVARRWTCCDADAEDIVQDVLLRFWGAFGVLSWEHSDSQWARAVCQHWIRFRAAELWRRACMRHECALDELPQVPPCCGEGSETHLVAHTDYQLLLHDIAQVLSPQQWHMLQLYLEGYTYEEIAKQLGVCSGTVKRQFSRIRYKAQSVLSTFWRCEDELTKDGGGDDAENPVFPKNKNTQGE